MTVVPNEHARFDLTVAAIEVAADIELEFEMPRTCSTKTASIAGWRVCAPYWSRPHRDRER